MPDELTTQAFVRCTPEQLKRWKSAAAAEERSLSQWIRRTLDAALKKRRR